MIRSMPIRGGWRSPKGSSIMQNHMLRLQISDGNRSSCDRRPIAVALVHAVGPLDGGRHPADAALGVDDLDVGELAAPAEHHPDGVGLVATKLMAIVRTRAPPAAVKALPAARSDVHADRQPASSHSDEDRVPVAAEVRRQPEVARLLGDA